MQWQARNFVVWAKKMSMTDILSCMEDVVDFDKKVKTGQIALSLANDILVSKLVNMVVR